MQGTDMVMCELSYTGDQDNDKFTCYDRYSVDFKAPEQEMFDAI